MRNQSIEQFVQLGGRRRRCTVEVGFVVLEGIGAIGHENMEMEHRVAEPHGEPRVSVAEHDMGSDSPG